MYLGFNLKRLISGFKFAFSGIKTILKEEQSFRIMILIAILVVATMIYFDLTLIEKAILVLAIILVLSLELMNSVMERILNVLHPQIDPQIKKIKDIFAGIVLITCFGAALVGILIFLPYFLK
jgi:undecaprenol kinase/diacylglycerol kinase (ATP)